MKISMIAAMDRNRLIGTENRLPWHLPADFAWFKQQTMGKPIVMGRKTYESIGKPLPGRQNIVISRNRDLVIEDVTCVTSIEEAVRAAGEVEELMVIGGGSIYELVMGAADRLYLTSVDAEFEGDAWFPEISTEWEKVYSQIHSADDRNEYGCEFAIYEKSS